MVYSIEYVSRSEFLGVTTP